MLTTGYSIIFFLNIFLCSILFIKALLFINVKSYLRLSHGVNLILVSGFHSLDSGKKNSTTMGDHTQLINVIPSGDDSRRHWM